MTAALKYVGAVLLAVVVVIALREQFAKPPKDGRLAIAQAQIAELIVDQTKHAERIKELEDSLGRRLTQAQTGQQESRRLAQKDSLLRATADSMAAIAITAHDWELAYQARTLDADTLRRGLSVAQQSTNDALAALAFSRLQHMADSTRLAKYDQAAPVVLAASKPNWWKNRVVVSGGFGVQKTGAQITTGPQLHVGIRLWSL